MDLSTSSAKRFCHDESNSDGSVRRTGQARKTIATHDGVFHCDEVLASVLLKQLPLYSNANILRTRDEKALSDCDVVVDVGGVYDASRHRYDHHQRSFALTMNSLKPDKPWKTKLSSAGLVYAHFGCEVIANLLNWRDSDQNVQIIFDKVYENFVQEIDAIDNGISVCDGEPNYRISTNISSRVANLNPSWNEPSSDNIVFEAFLKAFNLVETEFKDKVNYYGKSWWPARQVVNEAIKSRYEVDKSGEIIELKSSIPWKEHLFLLENNTEITPSVKFVIFSDSKGKWRVQSVPLSPHSFELRAPLCADWRGLRDDELSRVSQISDSIFVHSSGFIGGNERRDGALEMARKSLKLINI